MLSARLSLKHPLLQTTSTPPVLIVPFEFFNEMHGEAHGLEAFANWKATSRWTLSPGYAFERLHMHLAPTSHDTDFVSRSGGRKPRPFRPTPIELGFGSPCIMGRLGIFCGSLTGSEYASLYPGRYGPHLETTGESVDQCRGSEPGQGSPARIPQQVWLGSIGLGKAQRVRNATLAILTPELKLRWMFATAGWNSPAFARWPMRPWPSSPGRPWIQTGVRRCARIQYLRRRPAKEDESETGCSWDRCG